MVSYENDFYQFRAGLMDVTTGIEKMMGRIYNRCNARMIYDSRKRAFTPEFRKIVESFPDECANKK